MVSAQQSVSAWQAVPRQTGPVPPCPEVPALPPEPPCELDPALQPEPWPAPPLDPLPPLPLPPAALPQSQAPKRRPSSSQTCTPSQTFGPRHCRVVPGVHTLVPASPPPLPSTIVFELWELHAEKARPSQKRAVSRIGAILLIFA